MATLRLRQKIESDLNSKNDMLQTLGNISELLEEKRRIKLKRKIDVLDERIDFNESLLRPSDKKSKFLFKERVKRTDSTEFEQQRIKRGRLGQGADRKIDSQRKNS